MTDIQKKEFKEKCNTIFHQIGGNKLMVMTGVKDLMYSSSKPMPNIEFKLPRYGHTAINHISVILNGNDLYNITFSKFGKVKGEYKVKVIKVINDVFAEDLRGIFERETGLATRL